MKTRYQISEINATPFGGLFLFSDFLHNFGFHALFDKVFGQFRRIRKYRPSDNVSLLIATILSGGERLYDVDRLANDPVLPDLFANGEVPKDTTIRDDLQKIGQMDESRREILFKLNDKLFNYLKLKTITIDIDGTAIAVEGHQENAEKGYCPEAPGNRCFQSLAAVCDETETALLEETKPGETHCAKGIGEFCETLLDRFSPGMEKITLRMDKGFFSDELLRKLESYSNVIYEIAVPKRGWLKTKVKTLEYKSYFGSKREYAWFGNLRRRYFVERMLRPLGSQLDLLDNDPYQYRIIISNDLHRQPHRVFDHYNKRGKAEKHFSELKNEYALGSMISGNFSVTKALIWVSYLSFTLLGMFRKVSLRKDLARYRLRRLRFILFSAAAYFVKHARQKTLNIALPQIGKMRFKFILQRACLF